MTQQGMLGGIVEGAMGLQNLRNQQQVQRNLQQQALLEQQQAEAQAAQQAQLMQLQQAAAQGDSNAMLSLIGQSPEVAGQIQKQLGVIDQQSQDDAINKAASLKIMLDRNPEQAAQYWQENLANDPVFAGLQDNFAGGDFEGALNEIAMGVTAIGGQEAYKALFDSSTGADIGTYNPRDYTVGSFAEFVRGGSRDPSVLERYTEKTIDVGGVPHRLNAQTGSYEPLSTTTDVAASEAEIAGAKTEATTTAKQEVEATSPEAQEQRRLKEQERDRAVDLVDNLLESKNLSAISGFGTRIPVVGDVSAMTAQNELNDLRSLMNLMTMGNLGRMTGVLSESDIRLISQAASGLEVGERGTPVSEDRLREILSQIKGRLTNQEQPAQEQSPRQAQSQQYQEGATAYNPETGQTAVYTNGQWVIQ